MDIKPRLDILTKASNLVEKRDDNAVRCLACAHHCLIQPGKRGICGVRFNEEGELKVPFGYVAGTQIDPIEKKPFNHFLPGSEVLTFGMLGCNFHCEFCQNWHTSQALRDPCSDRSVDQIQKVSAKELTIIAVRNHVRSIASSYNEPLITSEWAIEVFKSARQNGLHTAMVSNGFGTPEVLNALHPHLTALKVDLKSMRDAQYKKMGGRLQPVLDTIHQARELGLWVEVVTLVIPGFNDAVDELWETSRFLVSISPDIPWHVTAYHPDYKMVDAPPTSAASLRQAAEIGQEAGLRYVYAGNLPGKVGSLEDTHCPNCSTRLIGRRGYQILEYSITQDGKCPNCQTAIAGIWN